jgi:hypothetical protein
MSTGATANQIVAGFVINPDIVIAQLTSAVKCCQAVPMSVLWVNRSHIDSVACVVAAGLISTAINKGFAGWFDNW